MLSSDVERQVEKRSERESNACRVNVRLEIFGLRDTAKEEQ